MAMLNNQMVHIFLYLMVKTHGFPVDFPLNQSIDIYFYMIRYIWSDMYITLFQHWYMLIYVYYTISYKFISSTVNDQIHWFTTWSVSSTGGRSAPCGVGDFRPAEAGAAGRSGAFEEGEVGRPRGLEKPWPHIFKGKWWETHGILWDFEGILMGKSWETMGFYGIYGILMFFFWWILVISMVILMVTKWDSMGLSWGNMMGFYRILMGFW